jgi:RNA polymerase sigma-70 factor (ECF subfamily)
MPMAEHTPERKPDPDAALVAAWQAGKLQLDQVEDLANRIMRWICKRPISRDDAEDLAAETIRRVQRKIDDFRGQAKFFTWVIEFAKRVVWEHCEKLGDTQLVSLEDAPEPEVQQDPEEIAIKRLTSQKALEALTPQQREVLQLHFGEGFTYGEIAAKLGITGNAAQLTGKRAAAAVGRHLKTNQWL